MLKKRCYQYDFSTSSPAMHDKDSRIRKAATMVAILEDYFDIPLKKLQVLDVGASTGIIDNHLANYFYSVQGIDIDKKAIEYANKTFQRDNLTFQEGDALSTTLPKRVFKILCQ